MGPAAHLFTTCFPVHRAMFEVCGGMCRVQSVQWSGLTLCRVCTVQWAEGVGRDVQTVQCTVCKCEDSRFQGQQRAECKVCRACRLCSLPSAKGTAKGILCSAWRCSVLNAEWVVCSVPCVVYNVWCQDAVRRVSLPPAPFLSGNWLGQEVG